MNKLNKDKSGGIFLIIKPRETTANGFSNHHFAVESTITGLVGAVEDATIENRTGNYIVKVKHEAQAVKLLKAKKLTDGLCIKVERHDKLNTSKAVIRCNLVAETDDRTLLKELGRQSVTEVRSIPSDRKTKILTFRLATPPETVNIGLIKVKTKKYYPMPKVCRKCKRIGHTTEQCQGNRRCARCSDNDVEHDETTCSTMPFCANCLDNHRPMDKACPVYQQEKAIIKIQVDVGLNPKEARRRYMTRAPKYYPLWAEIPRETNKKDPDSDGDVELIEENKPETSVASPCPSKTETANVPPKAGPTTAKTKRNISDVGTSTKKTPTMDKVRAPRPRGLSLTKRMQAAKKDKGEPKAIDSDFESSSEEVIHTMTID